MKSTGGGAAASVNGERLSGESRAVSNGVLEGAGTADEQDETREWTFFTDKQNHRHQTTRTHRVHSARAKTRTPSRDLPSAHTKHTRPGYPPTDHRSYTRTPTHREEKRGVLAHAFLGASAISSAQPAIFSKCFKSA